jgi:hypothetical protein
MAISTVALAGYTLPSPSTYRVDAEFVGGATQLANGKLRRHLVRASAVRRYILGWVDLTSSEKATLEAAWSAAVAAEVAFTSPDGNSVNVTAPPDARLSFEMFMTGGGVYFWRTTIELWEAV